MLLSFQGINLTALSRIDRKVKDKVEITITEKQLIVEGLIIGRSNVPQAGAQTLVIRDFRLSARDSLTIARPGRRSQQTKTDTEPKHDRPP